jgi:hypothetical protein|tara:strand:- start:11633 stop:12112 length:480 start_codon:yes stop_codon:yes gene_type:complete
MILENICPPALLYIAFSLTQVIIDIFKRLYNSAFIKFIVMVIFTIILNILCKGGLSIISWFIVFVPFIMMTVISTMLLFVFGLSPSSGSLDYKVDYPSNVEPPPPQGGQQPPSQRGQQPPPQPIQSPPPNKKSKPTSPETYNPNDLNSGTPDEINNYST